MTLIDSHVHLDLLKGDPDEMYINRAVHAGVHFLQTISTSLENFKIVNNIATKFKNVCCSLGTHPLHAKEGFDIVKAKELSILEKITAIGECGLDYQRNPTTLERQIQQQIFLEQINFASMLDLPIIVHMRAAERDTLEFLRNGVEKFGIKGVLHCFASTKEFAQSVLDLGFYISFSGIITFNKNIEGILDALSITPLDKLLIETDAPYLAPQPHRGKSNEPSYMIETAKKMALIKGVDLEEIKFNTTNNFFKLFKKAGEIFFNS